MPHTERKHFEEMNRQLKSDLKIFLHFGRDWK